MAKRDTTALAPHALVEVLRFCVVIFLTGVGYQVAKGLGSEEAVVGPFDAASTGMILGAAFGYVIGGLVARLTLRTVSATESALSGRSAEQLLAALVGAIVGVLVSAAMAWPVLLLGAMQYTAPLFIFVVVTVASLGYRLGLSQRDGVLALLGGRGSLETRRPSASSLPKLIDTSVAIDARIVDVVRAGFLHGLIVVPEPVLGELQAFADSADEQRRAKGRRGLEALETLRRERGVDLEVVADEAPEIAEVDGKLVHMALERKAALLTQDTNLARVAAVAGCRVMNLHALALALRPPVLAGDAVSVLLTRAGKEAGQAVGYLDDGTMVVVERARDRIGHEAAVVVTSVLVTTNGRLVFARLTADDPAAASVPAQATGPDQTAGAPTPADLARRIPPRRPERRA